MKIQKKTQEENFWREKAEKLKTERLSLIIQ